MKEKIIKKRRRFKDETLKSCFSLKSQLQQALVKAGEQASGLKLEPSDVLVEHPGNEEFGDYSTNLGLVLFAKLKTQSKDIKLDQFLSQIKKSLNKQSLPFIT